MRACFLDSSALAKRYLEEPGTPRVLDLLEMARIVVSRLALVEIASAAARRARAGGLAPDVRDGVLSALEDDLRTFHVVELSPAVLTRAVGVCRAHTLRASDAIQLACALVAGGDLLFVSSDRELNSAAEVEGFEVLDPADSSPRPQ
jgi:hypothetical protein